MKSEQTSDPVPKTCMVVDCTALAEDEDASNLEDFADELKEELMGTISGLEIQVGQLKDEVNNLQSRIERLENE